MRVRRVPFIHSGGFVYTHTHTYVRTRPRRWGWFTHDTTPRDNDVKCFSPSSYTPLLPLLLLLLSPLLLLPSSLLLCACVYALNYECDLSSVPPSPPPTLSPPYRGPHPFSITIPRAYDDALLPRAPRYSHLFQLQLLQSVY